jgi:hypothetical protein
MHAAWRSEFLLRAGGISNSGETKSDGRRGGCLLLVPVADHMIESGGVVAFPPPPTPSSSIPLKICRAVNLINALVLIEKLMCRN